MPPLSPPRLPVEERLDEIVGRLESEKRLVLSAEPGAGKSTLVPLALMGRFPGKILVLEPRRVAAKLLASYVAELASSKLGEKVGYHVRFDKKTSDTTRLVYLTEGLLRRYIQSDPFLTGVDAVVLDEFHERSINSDVGLMMLRKIQHELRPDLKILVMSATLDAGHASSYLNDAPTIKVPGRGFPVKISYAQKIQNPFDLDEISTKVLAALRQLLDDKQDDGGHVLVFLPGQREIRAVEENLRRHATSLPQQAGKPLSILPLYSQLPESELKRALDPRKDERKILLATNIAESSLTLDGLTAVVDAGLQRRSNVSLPHVIPYLELTRISRASAEQRSGRAGRQSPGRAVRLWSESEERFMSPFEIPEVQRSDPSTEMLSLLDIGFSSLKDLPWLDPPKNEIVDTVARKLRTLDLVVRDAEGRESLTPLGRASLSTALDMRWSLYLEHLRRDAGHVDEASLLRASTPELGPRDKEGDLEHLIESKASLLKHGATYRSLQNAVGRDLKKEKIPDPVVLKALVKAFLDRLARVRVRENGESDKALMWGNRGLKLPQRARDEIHREDFLLALDLDDAQLSNEDSRLRSYRWVPRKLVEELFAPRIREKTWAEKDSKTGGLRFWRAKHLDDFPLQDPIPAAADAEVLKRHRLQEILAQWPELEISESRLGQALRRLKLANKAPSPEKIEELLDFRDRLPADAKELEDSEDFIAALEGQLPHAERVELDKLFPKQLRLPSGRERTLDYRADGRVFLSTRLPDFFGLKEHPTINRGQIKLHLEILSPAQRPWQITQDLPNFWKSSYLEIRKEMKARYPRQPWPDDPTIPVPAKPSSR